MLQACVSRRKFPWLYPDSLLDLNINEGNIFPSAAIVLTIVAVKGRVPLPPYRPPPKKRNPSEKNKPKTNKKKQTPLTPLLLKSENSNT